jgi:hypothetical protein
MVVFWCSYVNKAEIVFGGVPALFGESLDAIPLLLQPLLEILLPNICTPGNLEILLPFIQIPL